MLCDPVSYSGNSPVLVDAILEEGPLSLNYVATGEDMPDIFELFRREVTQQWDVTVLLDAFQKSLSYIAESNNSQAFMLRLGEVPLFEIEIREVRMYNLQDEFVSREEDYRIQVSAGDFSLAAFPLYVSGLRLCLGYFWKFPEVKRIIAPVYTGLREEQQAGLFSQAGMTLTLPRTDPRLPDLFLIERPL